MPKMTNHQHLSTQKGPGRHRAFIVSISMLLIATVAVGWLMVSGVQEPALAAQTPAMGAIEAGEGFLSCLAVAFVLNIVNEPRDKN